LIENLRKERQMTFLLITHDLASARYLCDRIAIMYAGKIVEIGFKNELFTNPQHPYTKALLSAVPVPDPKHKIDRIIIGGEVPSLINPPKGCRFNPRCPYAETVCQTVEPILDKVGDEHYVACIPKPFYKK
ncbi:MAG: ABC transporter ATP-binding protein, partial [Nitrososphaerales archaeon]